MLTKAVRALCVAYLSERIWFHNALQNRYDDDNQLISRFEMRKQAVVIEERLYQEYFTHN
jgi:hypothetical protein